MRREGPREKNSVEQAAGLGAALWRCASRPRPTLHLAGWAEALTRLAVHCLTRTAGQGVLAGYGFVPGEARAFGDQGVSHNLPHLEWEFKRIGEWAKTEGM